MQKQSEKASHCVDEKSKREVKFLFFFCCKNSEMLVFIIYKKKKSVKKSLNL